MNVLGNVGLKTNVDNLVSRNNSFNFFIARTQQARGIRDRALSFRNKMLLFSKTLCLFLQYFEEIHFGAHWEILIRKIFLGGRSATSQ